MAFKGVCQYGFSDVYMDSSIKLTVGHFQTKRCKMLILVLLINWEFIILVNSSNICLVFTFRKNNLILKYFCTLLIGNNSVYKEYYFVQLYKEEIYKHIVLTTNYLLSFILHLPIAMLVYLYCLYNWRLEINIETFYSCYRDLYVSIFMKDNYIIS